MRTSLPLLVGLALCTTMGIARAQQPPAQPPTPVPAPSPPPPGELEVAKVHFQQGVALYNDGNFTAALAEFNEAYRLHKTPGVLYNIGLTQKSLFRYGEAIETLGRFLTESTALAPERKTEVEQLINEMRALLADVTFDVEPAGAAIAIDGRNMGQAPLQKPLGLAAGQHQIDVTFEGYKPARKELLVTAGVPLTMHFKLELIPHTGKVHIVASVPLSTVTIDGKSLGYAPVDAELGLGGHTLEVSAAKYDVHREELVIAAGQMREVSVVMSAAMRKPRIYEKWYFWTPIVLVLAGAGVGLGVGLSQPQPLAGTLSPGVQGVN